MHLPVLLHGRINLEERWNILEQFNLKSKGVMIATGLVSRGLHFQNIGIVILYELSN